MLNKDKLILINEIKKFKKELNEWEQNFINSILDIENLSLKQAKCLEKIYAKCVGGGNFIKKEF